MKTIKLSNYKIISSGAHAQVYSAFDDTGKIWAVKFFDDDLEEDPSKLKIMIEQQAKALMRVNHPNIVKVNSLKLLNHPQKGTPSLAMIMDHIEGSTLEEFTSNNHTNEQIKQMGLEMIDALDALHRAGLIHGDIHEQNILINGDLKPIIIDVLYQSTLALRKEADKSKIIRRDTQRLFHLLRDLIRRIDYTNLDTNTFINNFKNSSGSTIDLQKHWVEMFNSNTQNTSKTVNTNKNKDGYHMVVHSYEDWYETTLIEQTENGYRKIGYFNGFALTSPNGIMILKEEEEVLTLLTLDAVFDDLEEEIDIYQGDDPEQISSNYENLNRLNALTQGTTNKAILISMNGDTHKELFPIDGSMAYRSFCADLSKEIRPISLIPGYLFILENTHIYTGGAHNLSYTDSLYLNLETMNNIEETISKPSLDAINHLEELVQKLINEDDAWEDVTIDELEVTYAIPRVTRTGWSIEVQITAPTYYAASDMQWNDYTVSKHVNINPNEALYPTLPEISQTMHRYLNNEDCSTLIGWTNIDNESHIRQAKAIFSNFNK